MLTPGIQTSGAQSPAISASGPVTVTYGLTPEQVEELTKAAAAGAVGPLVDKIVDLTQRLGITQGAALSMLRILDEQDVSLEQLPQKLAEVALQYQRVIQRFAAFDPQDPVTQQLVERGREAAKNGRFQEAHDLLSQAAEADIAAGNHAIQAANQRLLRAAAARATRGELAMTQLDYLGAAEHFRAAAEIVPSSAVVPWAEYVNRQADALTRHGHERADDSALRKAIDQHRNVVQKLRREEMPVEWSTTQNCLSYALWRLGERESGTARLEEAAAAARAALEGGKSVKVPFSLGRGTNQPGRGASQAGRPGKPAGTTGRGHPGLA
jgi:tetratricopeptide (TPR) repeat protein